VSVKVVVDYDRCASNAVCMSLLPEIFEVRDDGFMYVLNEHPPESLRDQLEEAVRSCPTQAISLAEE
jgi:ferredoxin